MSSKPILMYKFNAIQLKKNKRKTCKIFCEYGQTYPKIYMKKQRI